MFFYNKCVTAILAAAISMALLTGCDRRTPEERLAAAGQFYQEGDQLSAEMEALKVIEKAPEDPVAVEANVLLAQIYASQNRFDEAELQLESALKNVSQLEPGGKELLKMYLSILQNQDNFDKALEVIDKYQKEYAEDPGTSLSLRVASADVRTAAGRTTESRAILQTLIDETTAPEEAAIYKDLYVRTLIRDRNSTGAIEYLENQLATTQKPEAKRPLLMNLAGLYAQTDNYEKSRQYLEALTAQFGQVVQAELDNTIRTNQSLSLAQTYMQLGNLPGARRILQTLYDTGISDAQVAAPVIMGMVENLLRLGETSATLSFLADADAKYPALQIGQQRQQIQDLVAKGQLQSVAPVDTSTIVMKYRDDANVLWPAELPQLLGVETTGTTTADTGSTATTPSAPEPAAVATTESESAASPASPAAPETPADTPAPAVVTETPAPPQTPVAEEPAGEATPAPQAPSTDTGTTTP